MQTSPNLSKINRLLDCAQVLQHLGKSLRETDDALVHQLLVWRSNIAAHNHIEELQASADSLAEPMRRCQELVQDLASRGFNVGHCLRDNEALCSSMKDLYEAMLEFEEEIMEDKKIV